MALTAITELFIDSAEYDVAHPANNADFVEVMYGHILDRPSEPASKNYRLDRLVNGLTRDGLIAFFARSPDFRSITNTY